MIVARDVDSSETNDPAVLDRYMARASNLASRDNPYSEIHLFVNHDKTVTGALKVDTSRRGGRHGNVLRLQAAPAGDE